MFASSCILLAALKSLGESAIEYRRFGADPHDPFERRKPAHELRGELDKTGSGEHRDCPQAVFVRDQPSCPFTADIDGCAAYFPGVDEEFDRIGAVDPGAQGLHRRLAELAHITPGYP